MLAKKQWDQGQLKLGQTSKLAQLNKCFQVVFLITDLKIFQHYNKVIQQIGKKQKAIVKQLIVATTLFPIHDALKAIQYARAIFDFIMLVQYILHDNKMPIYRAGIIQAGKNKDNI